MAIDRDIARHAVGLGSIALIVAAIWGLTSWEWAAIAAGLPPAAFYMIGEYRDGGPD